MDGTAQADGMPHSRGGAAEIRLEGISKVYPDTVSYTHLTLPTICSV